MPEIVKTDVAITATTKATAQKTELIEKKHIIISAKQSNSAKIYVAISYERETGRRSTDFQPLERGQQRFYGSPKDKKICYLWYYCATVTQYFNYVASDGTMIIPDELDFTIEFPYEHAKGLIMTVTATDVGEVLWTPDATNPILVVGFDVYVTAWIADDFLTIIHKDATNTVVHYFASTLYLPKESVVLSFALKKPYLIPAGEKITAEWHGTSGTLKAYVVAHILSKTKVT